MNIYNQISIVFFVFIFLLIYKIFKKEKLDNTKLLESFHLTEYDKLIEIKTRKRWLISFMLLSVSLVFLIFFNLLVEEDFKEKDILLLLVISILGITPWFWITYHCSFKKRGTAWLTWTMVIIPLRELIEISKGEYNDIGEWNALIWFFVILFFGIKAYYFFNCYSLRKVNFRRRKIESDTLFKGSAECSNCVLNMNNSQSVDDLNEIFGYAIGKWPQWEKQLSRVYSERKEYLLENSHLKRATEPASL